MATTIALADNNQLLPLHLLCKDSYSISPNLSIPLWRVKEPKRIPIDMPLAKSDLWAHVWGVSLLLAQLACSVFQEEVVDATVLDIGTGMGVSSIALAISGAALVVATDFAPESVAIGRMNAELNGFNDSRLRFDHLNWHEPLDSSLVAKFHLVVGADVIYMRNALSSIARIVDDAMLSGGITVLVDAGRPNVEEFQDACFDRGLVATHYDIFRYQTSVCVLRKASIVVVTKGEPSLRSQAIHQRIAEFCKSTAGLPLETKEVFVSEFGCCQKT